MLYKRQLYFGMSHVTRNVLQSETGSISSRDHRWFNRRTRKKKYVTKWQNNNNNNNNSDSDNSNNTLLLIEFLTSQLWLGNFHLSWDAVIKKIRLGCLIYSLKSFLQLNMYQELQIFAFVYMYTCTS